MDGGPRLALSRRLQSLKEKFRDKQYRDGYVASHTRRFLADQMRNLRGELSQADFAVQIGKQKTVIARLENPAYGGWSLRTMLDIARKRDLAVVVRFVDFPTFLKNTEDQSDIALHPSSYDETVAGIESLAASDAQSVEQSAALKAFFASIPEQKSFGASASEAATPQNGSLLPQMRLGGEPEATLPRAVNDPGFLTGNQEINLLATATGAAA